MQELCIAMSEKGSDKVFQRWDERSAGAWRNHVKFIALTDDKIANDGIVSNLAKSPNTLVFASQHLTSADVARQKLNVRRFQANKLIEAVERWLDENDLDWRVRTKRHCKKTPFKCISADEWVSQFAKVDPKIGRRTGAALLAQLRVIDSEEFSRYFSDLSNADLSTYFIGADRHSGDLALVSILSAQIDNAVLIESREIPVLKKNAMVRLFCDGSWSGGETKRRIRCMLTKCEEKSNFLEPTQRLDVHVGFLTDIADRVISADLQALAEDGIIQKGHVRVTYPKGNRLEVTGVRSGQKGLAFHDPILLRYVDEDLNALRRLCKKIGEEVLPQKPLGTNEIGSCIAFSHSLPAAMLPLFTIDGAQVTDSNGEKFIWRALLKSQHVTTGIKDDPNYHCGQCPLGDRATKGLAA